MVSKITILFVLLNIAALSRGMTTMLKESMPAGCNGNFCFNRSDYYPQAIIDKLIEKVDLTQPEEEHEHRTGDHAYDKICESDTGYSQIYQIIDEDDALRYVIQTSESARKSFTQKMRTEMCIEPGQITRDTNNLEVTTFLLDTHEFYCNQEYIDYSFLVLSLDGQKIETAKAKGGIPVCCRCMAKEKNPNQTK